MSLNDLKENIAHCTKCWLFTHRSLPFGNPNAKYMFIGLNPGYVPGRFGIDSGPFQLDKEENRKSSSSLIFSKWITQAGIDINDCYVTNLVKCATKEKKPTQEVITNCHDFIKTELAMSQAKKIICLGKVAGFEVANLANFWDVLDCNWNISDAMDRQFLLAWHPNYVLRKQTLFADYVQHLKAFIEK